MCTKKYLKVGSTSNNNIPMKIGRIGKDIDYFQKSKDLKSVK